MNDNFKTNKRISMLQQLLINDCEQTVMINGDDRSNPLLLFLHGGPGTPQIGYARKYQKKLEEHFTVVNWDQRGAGLSYSKDIPESSMTLDQLTADTIHLTERLCKQFGRQKVYIAGYSWGSVLALHVLQKRSDLYYAYIGISQVVNIQKEEAEAYRQLTAWSRERKHRLLQKTLDFIGAPPWDGQVQRSLFLLCIEMKGGGFTHNPIGALKAGGRMLFGEPYGVRGSFLAARGQMFSLKHLWEDLIFFDAGKSVSSIEIPCCFMSGKFDLTVPGTTSYEYYQKVEAPYKEWHWFENSAHSPHLEEPDRFAEVVSRFASFHL
ncbi:alpha/beta hydrolase [Bacillus siamensis]|uniref:prolyl aminopeptidase n=1 Tax=Bacillus siamensis TaxID=659243 RepID=A0AAI8N096_9BACI|nr:MULTISPECIES: alpha/beta hydrolase [Bacillus]AME06661.1 aminopeptidase [Bacillus sp. SDLI1]AUJ79135.1 alpha/beta hydrolase [Bacillus siamensis]UUA84410.1 alpha/beta hydrolase [Bacillus siamensis]